jgi:hypothetical protein
MREFAVIDDRDRLEAAMRMFADPARPLRGRELDRAAVVEH